MTRKCPFFFCDSACRFLPGSSKMTSRLDSSGNRLSCIAAVAPITGWPAKSSSSSTVKILARNLFSPISCKKIVSNCLNSLAFVCPSCNGIVILIKKRKLGGLIGPFVLCNNVPHFVEHPIFCAFIPYQPAELNGPRRRALIGIPKCLPVFC